MEFKVKQVIGLSAERKNAVCMISEKIQNRGDASPLYLACAGSGVVLGEVSDQNHSLFQKFYYEPPEATNPHKRSPQSSPDLNGKSTAKMMRINKAACVAAHGGRGLLACGEEVGYMPRLVLYNLVTTDMLDSTADTHQFGVTIVKFSPSGKLLVSMGTPQDGFINVWDVSNESLTHLCSNKCISVVNELLWLNECQFLTIGVRHLKVWTVDGGLLNGRNIVLGSLIHQKFTSAVSLDTHDPNNSHNDVQLLVGTDKGDIFQIPGSRNLSSDIERPIHALCLIGSTLAACSSNAIFKYKLSFNDSELKELTLIEEYKFGAKGLYAVGAEFYYLSNDNEISHLGSNQRGFHAREGEPQWLLRQKSGINLSSSEKNTLVYTADSKFILKWPTDIINVPLDDISVAMISDQQQVIAGSLSGDVFINGKIHNAHNGPVTDAHIIENLAVSASRDRFVQIWSYVNQEWSLKQTLNFASPVLKLRLTTNEKGWIALCCCCANKSLYVYTAAHDVNLLSESEPIFSEMPNSVLLKGMPFDITTNNGLVALSCNDKNIHVIDPWSSEKIIASWRARDSNEDSVNLAHIQSITYEGQNLLIGSSSNKAIALYTLASGELLACQYGYGESISGIAWTGVDLLASSDNFFISEISTCPNKAKTKEEKHMVPDLHVPGSPPHKIQSQCSPIIRAQSNSPERKLFLSSSATRSRSISPIRSLPRATQSDSNSLPQRSLSPPPRISKSTSPIAKERGRALHLANSGDYAPPKLQFKKPITNVMGSAELESSLINSLKEFIKRDDVNLKSDELKGLLISALHKVDGFAAINEFSAKVLDMLKTRIND